MLTFASDGWQIRRAIGRARWKAWVDPVRRMGEERNRGYCDVNKAQEVCPPPSPQLLLSGRHGKMVTSLAFLGTQGDISEKKKGSDGGTIGGASRRSTLPEPYPPVTLVQSCIRQPSTAQVPSPGNREERVKVKALLGVNGVEATKIPQSSPSS